MPPACFQGIVFRYHINLALAYGLYKTVSPLVSCYDTRGGIIVKKMKVPSIFNYHLQENKSRVII